jgi:hypothetical protein
MMLRGPRSSQAAYGLGYCRRTMPPAPMELDHLVGGASAHANIVPDHEGSELGTIDRDDALADAADILARSTAERGRAEKDAFGHPHSVPAPGSIGP